MLPVAHTALTLESSNTSLFVLCSGETGFRHEGDHLWPAECWETCQSFQSEPRGKKKEKANPDIDYRVSLKLQGWSGGVKIQQQQ